MRFQRLALALLPLALLACTSGPTKPKPASLVNLASPVQARTVWSLKLPPVDFFLKPQVQGDALTLAAGSQVWQLDAATGRERWRQSVGAALSAGVGSDGQRVAVLTQANELVVLQEGQVLWRQRLSARSHTPPLVAGERVFVLGADRMVSAFDGRSGARLWTQQRPGNDPLVLRQGGVLLPVGDTLVVGLSGRLVGLNPLNGAVRWDAPVAVPRGINEIERLVDLVDPVARQANIVCARAFQAAVACVNAESGNTLWSRPADGTVGLASDGGLLFGTEANGEVLAWRRSNGDKVWSNERLRFRDLTAPAVVGPYLAVGDFQGQVHLLSREDGSLVGRVPTDGSPLAATPTLVGDTLVVVTRGGGVYGIQWPR